MAITVICLQTDVGAYESRSYPGVWLRDFAEGCVVDEREMNGYDDSDFYATYYNPETDTFHEVQYGTTRAWTYPCNARIDATPEIMEKYRAYQRRCARHRAAWHTKNIREKRKAMRDSLRKAGLSDAEAWKLAKAYAYTPSLIEAFASLLKTSRKGAFRSTFRASLAQRVNDWLQDPAPKYALPLSNRQLQYL